MAKVRQQTENASADTGTQQQAAPIVKVRKPRRDGRPHPPEGMRYAKDGSLKPKIPPEMRGYYVVVGMNRRTGAPSIAGRFKSSMKAIAFCNDYAGMLQDTYSVVSVNKMRLFKPIFGQ